MVLALGQMLKPWLWLSYKSKEQGKSAFGAGIHDNIVTSSIEAIIACTNRLIDQGVLSTDQVIAAAV